MEETGKTENAGHIYLLMSILQIPSTFFLKLKPILNDDYIFFVLILQTIRTLTGEILGSVSSAT